MLENSNNYTICMGGKVEYITIKNNSIGRMDSMRIDNTKLHGIADLCSFLGIGRTTAYELTRIEILAFKAGNKWN